MVQGINIDGLGNPLVTVPEMAKAVLKSTGSISSVRYNHATPAAGGGAHHISRNNYIDISYEMFGSGVLDLIGGRGHPWYYANGEMRDEPNVTSTRFDKRPLSRMFPIMVPDRFPAISGMITIMAINLFLHGFEGRMLTCSIVSMTEWTASMAST